MLTRLGRLRATCGCIGPGLPQGFAAKPVDGARFSLPGLYSDPSSYEDYNLFDMAFLYIRSRKVIVFDQIIFFE